MAGTTAVDFIIFNNFCKKFEFEKEKSLALLEIMSKLSVLLIAGAILLIVSGTDLFFVTHGVFAGQFWFKFKMGLIVVLILNGSFFGGRQESKLKNIIRESGPDLNRKIRAVNWKLQLFHAFQAAIFFTIIILAIFKFN
jgi:hypothetical protein